MNSTTTTTKITRTTRIALNRDLLMKGIESKMPLHDGENIVSAHIEIPSGGDYSGMQVDPDDLIAVVVTETVIHG